MRPTGYRCWIASFRERGIKRMMTLGRVGKIDAKEARSVARKRLVANRLDGLPKPPAAKPRIGSPLFRYYVDPFWADYARHWKPSTQARNRWLIRKELVPSFGDVALDAFTRAPDWRGVPR